MTTTRTMPEFIEAHGITMIPTRIKTRTDSDTNWPRDASHWRCDFRRGPLVFQIEYTMGSALKPPPVAAEALECIQSDVSSIVNSKDFAAWADDYGYDSDSIKVLRIYEACSLQMHSVMQFLGVRLFADFLDVVSQ